MRNYSEQDKFFDDSTEIIINHINDNSKTQRTSWAITREGEIIEWDRDYLGSISVYVNSRGSIRKRDPVWRDATKDEVPKEFLTVLILNGLEFKFKGESVERDK